MELRTETLLSADVGWEAAVLVTGRSSYTRRVTLKPCEPDSALCQVYGRPHAAASFGAFTLASPSSIRLKVKLRLLVTDGTGAAMMDLKDPAASALLGWSQAERSWWGAAAAVFGSLSVTGAAVAADDAGQSGGGASASLMQRVADKLARLEGQAVPDEPDWDGEALYGEDDHADESGDEDGRMQAVPQQPSFAPSARTPGGVPGWSAVRRGFGGRGRPEDFSSVEDAGMALRRELVDRLGLSSGGAGLAASPSGTGHFEVDAEVQAGWGVRKALAAAQSKATGCTAEQAAEVAMHKWRMCMEGADSLPWRLGTLSDRETGPFSLPLLQLRALRIVLD